jgi:triosephosphate isomerase
MRSQSRKGGETRMYDGVIIEPPFFEIGPKTYLHGQACLALAKHADKIGREHDVRIIFTPQYVDIPLIAANTDFIYVAAQHMDFLRPGRGIGAVLPEALRDAGAMGVLLNHAEKPLTIGAIEETITRADEVGLFTLVCADTPSQALAFAQLRPNILLVEPPALIGQAGVDVTERDYVRSVNVAVKAVDPRIQVLHGAGIKTGQDVRDIVSLGADATGCTSGIFCAEDPFAAIEEMISNLRDAWDMRISAENLEKTNRPQTIKENL